MIPNRQRWARDVKAPDRDEKFKFRDETETRRLKVTRRRRDVNIGLGLHVIGLMIAVVTLFSRPLIMIKIIMHNIYL